MHQQVKPICFLSGGKKVQSFRSFSSLVNIYVVITIDLKLVVKVWRCGGMGNQMKQTSDDLIKILSN